jgi:cytochrome c-type biogenesis protein CcmE
VKDATDVVHVKSTGAPPQMFRENIGVVVEGTMVQGGYFRSDRLLVSHNNEYKAPEKGHPVDKKELERMMKSTEGLKD